MDGNISRFVDTKLFFDVCLQCLFDDFLFGMNLF